MVPETPDSIPALAAAGPDDVAVLHLVSPSATLAFQSSLYFGLLHLAERVLKQYWRDQLAATNEGR